MKQTIGVNGKDSCSACGACFAICPKRAITMSEDEYGFLYPSIDQGLCVSCGKCFSICKNIKQMIATTPLNVYAAAGKDKELVFSSASGGIFASMAKQVLNDGGKIAGAVMILEDGILEVRHLMSEMVQDLYQMQGSKYVQSDAWKCYDEVLEAVKNGDTVLFSGTPCQVAAIKSITGNPHNLITIDIVCHGVPSVTMLRAYVDILSKRFMGIIEGFSFRDKTCRKAYCARINVKRGNMNHRYYLRSSYISFYKYFLEGLICRENCYYCSFACKERISDITIGDYWGIEQIHAKEIQSDRYKAHQHWSCLLINTEKGKQLLDQCGSSLDLIPSKLEWAALANQQLNAPSIKPEKREAVLSAFAHGGYKEVERGFKKESGGNLRFFWRSYRDMKRNARNKSVPLSKIYENRTYEKCNKNN